MWFKTKTWFTNKTRFKNKTWFKNTTRFKYKNLGHGPYGQRPIWARAHMGSGPLGPGPFLVGRTPHQKTHPGKKSPNCVFLLVFWKQKRCATSVRSFWRRYRAEISAMCQKTKVSVFEKRHNLVVDYLSICEFATRRRL